MPIIEFLIECLFHYACGWLGHMFVKIITFGKVDLDWPGGSESVMAEVIGLAIVVIIGFGIFLVI